jgi:DNA-binding response OmpR family regulator
MRDDPSPATILLVEDDPSLREIIEEVLSEEAYYVIVAHSGQEAFQLARQTRIDLLLTDYMLGGDIDGIALYDALHALPDLSTTPALVMSAALPFRELQARHLVGMAKPFDLDDLLMHVSRALERRAVLVGA